MKLINEYRTNWIEIEKSEEQNYYSTLRVSIGIKTHHLYCFFENIWIEQEEIISFISDLQRIDEKREGQVKLAGMSPEIFQLTIQAIDKSGHLVVMLRLENYLQPFPEYKEIVQTGFELDPSSIPEIIVGLKRIIN